MTSGLYIPLWLILMYFIVFKFDNSSISISAPTNPILLPVSINSSTLLLETALIKLGIQCGDN